MKTLVNSSEIAHLWAHQTQLSARSAASVSFDGPNFYSYSTIIGSIVTGKDGSKAFLLGNGSYSVTTSKHQSWMREAAFGREFNVPGVSSRNSNQFSDPSRIMSDWTTEVAYKLSNASKAREPKKTRLILEATQLVDEMREFAEFMGLKKVKYPPLPHSVAELSAMMAKEERRKAVASKKAETQRKQQEEKARLEALPKAEAWMRGEDIDPYHFSRYTPTLLRVVDGEIETSMGAVFPITHAKRGLALVDMARTLGKEWQRNGHTCHIGHYQIDRITPDGTVYAGCHIVPFESIEKIRSAVEAA